MAVAVDSRTNSLLVCAPEPLLDEVRQVVEQLDQAATQSDQAMDVVTLHRASPQSVQAALSAIMGENVQIGRSGSGAQPGGAPGQSSSMRGFNPQSPGFQQFQGRFRQGPGGSSGTSGSCSRRFGSGRGQ